jgi:ubiquitin carboxyl-terminal hydrolase 2/21
MKGKLASAFAELATSLWDKDTPQFSAISPAVLKRIIGKWAPHFSGYEQQDCGEFLCFLLNGLAEDVKRKQLTLSSPSGATGGSADEEKEKAGVDDANDQAKADEMWKQHLVNNNSFITDLFAGQLQSCVECLTCGNKSSSFDPFMDLSVPIPKHAQTKENNEVGARFGRRLWCVKGRGLYSLDGPHSLSPLILLILLILLIHTHSHLMPILVCA